MDTNTAEYASYLIERQKTFRAKVFQLPYQTHLRALGLGKTLEVGCGAGRNLKTCSKESVGIDHNPLLVQACKNNGLNTYTTQEWDAVGKTELHTFDTLLIAHVAEHLPYADFVGLLKKYTAYLKPNGKFMIICPQERGYQTDATHVEFMDFKKITSALKDSAIGQNYKITIDQSYSFPFPRFMGKHFPYNEFVVRASISA